MLRLKCPMCGSTITAADHWAGKSAECPKCKATLRMPQVEPVPDAPPVHLIRLECPSCGQSMSVAASERGKHCRCPSCGDTLRVPGPPQAIEAVAVKAAGKAGLGWWAFFLGVLSLAFCAPLGICALVMGFMSLNREKEKGYALAGVIMGGLSAVIWGALTILWLAIPSTPTRY